MAVALEQEMRARVVEAESEVPRAMAEAFRQGNLGIMDYYRMKNIQADSSMPSQSPRLAGTNRPHHSGRILGSADQCHLNKSCYSSSS